MFSHLARWSLHTPLSSLDRDLIYRQAPTISESPPKRDFLVGLSVGQGAQSSGVAVLERLPPEEPGASRNYACRYLRRWVPPDTAYPTLVSNLNDMFNDELLNRPLVRLGPSAGGC